MSDQEAAFQNWQDAAQEAVKQPQTIVQNNQQVSDQQKQKKQQQSQHKPQEAKQTLKQKIQTYKKITLQSLQNDYMVSENGSNKKTLKLAGGKVFKSDKDFIKFGQQIGEKLCEGIPADKTLDQDSIVTFFEELTLFLYDGLKWSNFFQIIGKVKVVKNQRKEDEKKMQKQKQKQKLKKPEQSPNSSKIISQPTKKETDNLFGNVSNLTSLQQQQERKGKKKVEQEQKPVQQKKVAPPPPPADDDDYFM